MKLLDAYVLWVIGSLPPEQETLLQQMTAKLRQTWNRTGEHWHEVLAAEMQFPPSMPMAIRDMWRKNQSIAENSGVKLAPVDFAHMFVDQNFNR